MSTSERHPLDKAREAADVVMQALRMREPECRIVGSIRRRKPDVGDIEIIAPLPTGDDPLARRINECFTKAKQAEPDLFNSPKAQTLGTIVSGGRAGFKAASLVLTACGIQIPVQIFRYTPGPKGNRGWIELMRTGPAEYSELILSAWKFMCGTRGTDKPGSDGGFLVDSMGNPRATPNEFSVYQAIGCVWAEPRLRTGPEALLRVLEPADPQRRAKALRHLGIATIEEARTRFDEEKLIALTE